MHYCAAMRQNQSWIFTLGFTCLCLCPNMATEEEAFFTVDIWHNWNAAWTNGIKSTCAVPDMPTYLHMCCCCLTGTRSVDDSWLRAYSLLLLLTKCSVRERSVTRCSTDAESADRSSWSIDHSTHFESVLMDPVSLTISSASVFL